MSDKKPIPRAPRYDDAMIEDLAIAVYRQELGEKDAMSMLAKDNDGGTKFRRRAQAYAPIIRSTLDALAEMEKPYD
jgi:hypothetical protein